MAWIWLNQQSQSRTLLLFMLLFAKVEGYVKAVDEQRALNQQLAANDIYGALQAEMRS